MAEGDDDKAASGFRKLVADVQRIALPLLVSGGGLLAFVAFVGGALTWARFSTANLPADQAVSAMPEAELVATGAVSLTLFALVGLLAVLVTYLISPRGAASKGMAYGLLVLVAVESAVVLAFAHDSLRETAGAALLLVAATAISVAVIELLGPKTVPVSGWLKRWWHVIRHRGAGAFRWLTPIRRRLPSAQEFARAQWDSRAVKAIRRFGPVRRGAPIVRGILALGSAVLTVPQALAVTAWSGIRRAARWSVKDPGPRRAAGRGDQATRATAVGAPAPAPGFRVRPLAYFVSAAVALLLGWGAGDITEEWWVAVSLPLAGLLGFGCFQVACAGDGFAWYGVAVFFSVPIFGAALSILRALDEPQVQPIALIRVGDGPDEGLQGIFVTENDERVYMATVARDACDGKHLISDSGRLFWVPRDQVVTYAIGPLQNAKRAARTAPAMLESLITTRIPADDDAERKADQRPISVPPAIRDRFDVDKIRPKEPVKPGDDVTITGEGFGRYPGTVTIDPPGDDNAVAVPPEDVKWRPRKKARDRITFTVPENAETGEVVVTCHKRQRAKELEIEKPDAKRSRTKPRREQ